MIDYHSKSKEELVKEIVRLLQIIEEQKQKCKTCRAVINAEIERGQRIWAQKRELTKKDILELQRKGVFIPPGRRSRVVD